MLPSQKSILKQLTPTLIVATLATSCVNYNNNNSQNQLVLAQTNQNLQENIVFPKSAAVIDVTASEYGAKPNDGKDDTKAIQKALSQFPSGGRIIYLPNGTYNISDSLHWPPGRISASDYKRTILQGQSQDGVTIQLNDSSAKFQDPKKPRPLISTGFDPDLNPNAKAFSASKKAQRFANSVRNLTINIGKKNPGAEGLNFIANNLGSVRSVKIISPDGQGTTGLALTHGEVGPLLVENVEVVGFDYGIRTNNVIAGITMQNITVRNQNRAGIFNRGQIMSLENLYSLNSVPAIINGSDQSSGYQTGGMLTLLNARLVGSGNAKKVPAISSTGFIYARNISGAGYKNVLSSKARNAVGNISGTTINEYTSRPIIAEFPASSKSKELSKESLQLPIRQFPQLPWDDPKAWVSVEKFGAKPNDKKDDTAAFQAAIDSGATTVVVPRRGNFTINGTLRLRKNLRRFIGTQGWIEGKGEIVADKGSQPTLIIENFYIRRGSQVNWRSVADRTVVFRSIENFDFESTGSGDLFIDDVTTDKVRFLNSDQSIWTRQLNVEGSTTTNVVNNGAKLWILGFKTEQGKTKIETSNGGFTELLGALIFSNGIKKQEPIFRIINAASSFAGVGEAHFNGASFQTWVEETRQGITRKLNRNEIPARTAANGRALVLYKGFE
ncbi:glycosyl hydrolase family 28-related protein [Halotia branconii]|uniref:Glycosyl hydrolase family 28-related protein n=1 Tax=Halotia branconii CENA392 TaxID=1539056 RepID=A0AAJ6NVU5_9CYAN|nr:glycosyl hydrolase family 28-related protein [Halotia branconii]WGV27443.1 glycosyl hydrolase family 28-related protein [Halotia branconii CENA392]